MGAIRTFLEDVKTRVEAVVDGSAVKVFNQVVIAPFVDIEALTNTPAAVIVDEGGTLDRINKKIMTRTFSVVIANNVPRDNYGEEQMLQLLDAGEFLVAALSYDTTIDIYNAADEDLAAIGTELGGLILVNTYRFVAVSELA